VRAVSPVVLEEIMIVIGIIAAAVLFRFVLSISESGINQASQQGGVGTTKYTIHMTASVVPAGSDEYTFCVYVSSQDEFNYHNPLLSISSAIGSLGGFTSFSGTCHGVFGPNPCSLCVTTAAKPSTYTLRLSCDECNPATAVVSAN